MNGNEQSNQAERMGIRLTVRVPDALHMLGIGRTKLYDLLGSGEIEAIKIGKATLILVDSIHGFVERQRTSNAPWQ